MFHRTSRNAALATSIAVGLALGTLPAAAQAPATPADSPAAVPAPGNPTDSTDARAFGDGRDSRGIGQEG